jgi:hypothetical protein
MDYLLELPGLMADDEKKERGFDSYIPGTGGQTACVTSIAVLFGG